MWDRPKRGFTVPVEDYLTNRWRDYCDDLVARTGDIAPWLSAAEVRRRWSIHTRGGKVDWPIYAIIVLLGWLDTHRLDYR